MTAPGAAQPRQSTAIPLEQSSEEDAPLTPFPSAIIEEMLRVFVKGVRAHQLYLHNNPTYVRALETLRAVVRTDLGAYRRLLRAGHGD